ncbi:MAG TPA: KpsF/GutQ family sugar-phosphate isomerase [Terriglobia bacterium]|nr:KpsF/GutQ family sugar-phosphate isomerase [Terriglobia bacterium]
MTRVPRSKPVAILDEISRVLDIEIEALQSVRDNLGPQFEAAVRAIAGCQGQVVVAGLGKSGIIANKIAATLRSTGTPAVYLHPSEAMHGDLGLVGRKDVALAVGKSGETGELNDLIRHIKKRGARVVAITSNGASRMAALSDIVLDLKVPREACHLNLAPTASTTAALAVGDAIAVAVMKIKNLSRDDFARLHPGGQLGRRLLLTVDDVMRKGDENPVIRVDRTVPEMLVQITAFRVGAISVVDSKGKLLGLVTDFDIRKALASAESVRALQIRKIMNPSPTVIFADQRAIEALETMKRMNKPTAVLPVLDRKRLAVGMIHLHDLIAEGL